MTLWRCFLSRPVAAASAAAAVHHGVRHVRRARRVRRAAAVIVCISVGSAAASLIPAIPYLLSPPSPPPYGGGTSVSGTAPAFAERPWAVSPGREGLSPTQVPEPGSLALLATAVAAMAAKCCFLKLRRLS